MPISDIVNVQITAQSQSVSQAGFGQLLLVGLFKNWVDLIRMYSNLNQVAADFSPSQPEYVAAQNFFSQPVVPPQLWIGRRTIDTAIVNLETAMSDFTYTTTINNTAYPVIATSNSIVTYTTSFVSGNFITPVVNGVIAGQMTSQITFSADFVASNVIDPIVNGIDVGPVSYTTDNDTTIAAVAAAIATATGVTSATVSGSAPHQNVITVVFTATSGPNTVNSCVTTGGASQPLATILQGTVKFTTDQPTTIAALAAVIAAQTGIASATVSGSNLVITVLGTLVGSVGSPAVVNSITTVGGGSQPVPTITYPVIVLPAMVAAMAADPTVTTTLSSATTYTIVSKVAGTPWSLKVATNIIQPINCNIVITQVIPGATYSVTVNGTTYNYVAAVTGSSSATISLGLVTVIMADPNRVVTATNNGNGTFELASTFTGVPAVQTPFGVTVTQNWMQVNFGLIIQPYNTSTPIATDLTALNNFNDEWYALALTDRTQATVLAAAAWTESNKKLFGTASSDPVIINQAPGLDITSIAYQLNLAGYIRTWLIYNQDAGNNQLPGPGLDYPECAWFGTMLWQQPGSNTWALKQLISTETSDLTTTQSNNARGKYANTYEYIAGVGVTRDGKVSGNEYIDIVIGIDWLTSTVQTYVFQALVNNSKIPYTDAGITCIQAEIERALDQGVNNNFIASTPAYVVTVPLATSVPPIDKANRVLNNVVFNATLAGAIQAVNITGTLSF